MVDETTNAPLTDFTNDNIDEFSKHEVLHTAHIMVSMFSDHLLDHVYVQTTPELKAEADAICEKLADFYQLCGRYTVMTAEERNSNGNQVQANGREDTNEQHGKD